MRKHQQIMLLFCFGILEFVAVINSFVMNLKGATVDAERFMEQAINWTIYGTYEFATNSEFFVQFVGTILLIFGPYEFVATQFGLVAIMIACIYFIKLLDLFDVATPAWAILGFTLWPSMLARVTTTLREPYMVMLLIMMCYFLARYKIQGRNRDVFKTLALGIVGVFFHKAYAVLLVFVLFYVAFFVMKQERRWIVSSTFYMRLFIIVGGIGGAVFALRYLSNTSGLKPVIAMLTGDVEYISRVIDWKSGREFRTTYDAALDFSSTIGFVLSVPKVIIYYMFSPFPWRISTPVDLLAGIEGLFRLGGTIIFVRYLFLSRNFPRGMVPVTATTFILIAIWAAGTTNYGTASRHHLTTNWLFIASYVMWFHMRSLQAVSTSKKAIRNLGRNTNSAQAYDIMSPDRPLSGT